MLRYLGLMVFVACIAAFASGCGGGGGGGGTAEEAVMECPQGQVGTYPDCMDPPPTDEERIDAAQDTLAGIIADAQTREQAARADASAVQGHDDATEAQKTDAGSLGDDARNALTDIVTASAVANVATTGAQAEGAVADAQAALSRLTNAQTSLASLLRTVNAVGAARRQLEEDERLATNGSGLIQHVRDNKILYDAILADLADTNTDPLTIGEATGGNVATYPKDTGTGADRVVGERGVMVNTLSSNSKTPTLSGTGRLPHGFDLKNADNTLLINAYTDITKTRADVRMRTAVLADDTGTPDDERYETVDIADTDYLLAGIWVQGNAIEAFAYGSQPIPTSTQNFCTGIENVSDPAGGTGVTRTCGDTGTLHQITDFVAADKDMTATYTGDANGAYLADDNMSYFEADVTLTAEFQNAAGTGSGTISGDVTNIVAAGKSIAGSVELQEHSFTDGTINAAFGGDAVGVVDGKSFSGAWKGQFFGIKTRKSSRTETIDTNDPQRTVTTTYSAEAPGSVAGTFYATQQSNPAGEAALIGSFAARR
ncbi:MAG: hypothetical protein OXQ29_20390 [Rhodospirillaceae bacterium]|nr:hypothetical protein [Rhodospirillaceae bacterium]